MGRGFGVSGDSSYGAQLYVRWQPMSFEAAKSGRNRKSSKIIY